MESNRNVEPLIVKVSLGRIIPIIWLMNGRPPQIHCKSCFRQEKPKNSVQPPYLGFDDFNEY